MLHLRHGHLSQPALRHSYGPSHAARHMLCYRKSARGHSARLRERDSTTVCSAAGNIRARWCIDIRYGVKLEALALLQEWVRDIGSQAGVTPFNAQINSGAVGVPESRLELEVSFDNMAELEQFWGCIPAEAHRAWSQRAQHVIIDGSPVWQERPRPRPRMSAGSDAAKPVARLVDAAQSASELSSQQADSTEEEGAYTGPVDWKGDPMVINPGDKGLGMFQ